MILRLICLRRDAIAVVDILDHAFWHSNHPFGTASGISLPAHQPCAMVEKIDQTITQIVQQDQPQIPQNLLRLDVPPQIIPRVDDLAPRTRRSPALINAMDLVGKNGPKRLGSEKLRTILEGLSLHEGARFNHYLRNYGYATLMWQGDIGCG